MSFRGFIVRLGVFGGWFWDIRIRGKCWKQFDNTGFGSHFRSYDRRYAEPRTCYRRRWLDDSFASLLVIPSPYEPSVCLLGKRTKPDDTMALSDADVQKQVSEEKESTRGVLPRNAPAQNFCPPSTREHRRLALLISSRLFIVYARTFTSFVVDPFWGENFMRCANISSNYIVVTARTCHL